MKQVLLNFLLLSYIVSAISQDLSKDLELNPKNLFDNYGFTEGGCFYLKYNKEGEFSKDKKGTVELFNTSLEQVYKYDVHKKFFISEITTYGKQIKSKNLRVNSYTPDYKFLNEDGDIYNYKSTGYKTFKFKPKGFKILDEFISKDNLYLLGYKKVSKKISQSKRKYQIVKRNLKTEETQEIDFELPVEISSKETLQLQVLKNYNSDNKISFLAKIFDSDESLGSDFSVFKSDNQVYRILNYNENLEFIDQQEFKVNKPEETLNFCNTRTSDNSFETTIDYKNYGDSQKTYTKYLAKPDASGNIVRDEENNFYTYCSVTSASGVKDSSKSGGVLINKFKSNGGSIWETYIETVKNDDKDRAYGPYSHIDFKVTKDNIVISSSSYGINILDKNNGALQAKETVFSLDFVKPQGDGNKRVLTVKDLKVIKKIPRSDYKVLKNFNSNLVVDKNTLMAYVANTKFKNYIDSFKDKEEEFHFITTINYDSIITLEIDFEKSKYKLHKFNL